MGAISAIDACAISSLLLGGSLRAFRDGEYLALPHSLNKRYCVLLLHAGIFVRVTPYANTCPARLSFCWICGLHFEKASAVRHSWNACDECPGKAQPCTCDTCACKEARPLLTDDDDPVLLTAADLSLARHAAGTDGQRASGFAVSTMCARAPCNGLYASCTK
jgi:hypothetical protein